MTDTRCAFCLEYAAACQSRRLFGRGSACCPECDHNEGRRDAAAVRHDRQQASAQGASPTSQRGQLSAADPGRPARHPGRRHLTNGSSDGRAA